MNRTKGKELKWGCQIVKCENGSYDVRSKCSWYWYSSYHDRWVYCGTELDDDLGTFRSKKAAEKALQECQNAPPRYLSQKRVDNLTERIAYAKNDLLGGPRLDTRDRERIAAVLSDARKMIEKLYSEVPHEVGL